MLSESDYRDIMHVQVGQNTEAIMEDWEFLQLKSALYINSETTGLPPNAQVWICLTDELRRLNSTAAQKADAWLLPAAQRQGRPLSGQLIGSDARWLFLLLEAD